VTRKSQKFRGHAKGNRKKMPRRRRQRKGWYKVENFRTTEPESGDLIIQLKKGGQRRVLLPKSLEKTEPTMTE